ncbi:MAG: adenylosuccinate lyase [Coprothermobacterota bacterium]|nr:adenylosuccinate lyase [Coprothermobacterota bacterium]
MKRERNLSKCCDLAREKGECYHQWMNLQFSRYPYPALETIWGEENQLQLWLRIELAVCQARVENGEIPEEACQRILKRASFGSVGEVRAIEEKTQHDLVAFLQAVESRLGEDFRFFHLGLTSQDIKDTGFSLQLKKCGEILQGDLLGLIRVFRRRARQHKYTWMIGRTHGIHAEPISFGLVLLRYQKTFQRHLRRLREATSEVSVGKFSGPVGTYNLVSPQIATRACALLGLKPAHRCSQIIPRDLYARFFQTLALIAAGVEEVALEVRHLQRSEVGELFEPFTEGQVGSSAMPHKRNPVVAERLCGLARIVRADAGPALENIPSWHERDISHSSTERVIGPQSTVLLGYMLQALAWVMDGLEVNPRRMAENIELTCGAIFSQPLLLALVGHGMPRSEAGRLVQRLAFQAIQQKIPLRQLLEREPQTAALPPVEVERIFCFDNLRERVDSIFAFTGEL